MGISLKGDLDLTGDLEMVWTTEGLTGLALLITTVDLTGEPSLRRG